MFTLKSVMLMQMTTTTGIKSVGVGNPFKINIISKDLKHS